ncbi:hypothetical protein [Paraburkholderia sp. UCT31]|uniref:hypothetical protein n=1 Tax=Paraburkholderia sp. UCT31 TaxID=2615209 RepID=UPI00165578AB|nr:hypothetical protein [Paraburkholderia sp. UCT31]
MSFPEWGNSYNALHVPLTSDWQCALVPARDVQDIDRGWKLSYEERQKARKEREEQIEQDQRDFDRYFRVGTSRRAARGCSDFRAYVAFISEHLRISGLGAPVDGDGVARILRDAVRDGRLVPAISRAWRGSRRVARPYGPQSWPNRMPDPKPTVYGLLDGQLVPFGADGRLIDRTAYVPAAASSSGGTDWLGVVEKAAGALLGGSGLDADSGGAPDMAASLTEGGASTALGDAQPFDYQPDMPADGSFDIAKTPNKGEPGTWYTNPGSGQMRLYGDDGKAVVDFDFDHDHGQGIPHAHNWDGGVRGAGLPFSLLP